MSVLLDTRRRAMLEEMGIRLFWPEQVPEAAEDLVEEPALATLAEQAEPDIGMPPMAPVRAPPPAPAVRPPVQVREPVTAREPVAGLQDMDWEALQHALAEWQGTGTPVFGVGDLQPDWLLVGEAPDESAVEQGEPFVGPAGKLLDNMLAAVGASRRSKAYITNVLKFCPPGNRNPEPEELAASEPFLRRQVELLRPRVILAMGRFSVQTLLQTSEPIGRLRGRVHRYADVPVVVTYHPAYLLRNLPDKAKAWADLLLAQSVIRGSA
jgi:uracil-DNA glycosylase family 4